MRAVLTSILILLAVAPAFAQTQPATIDLASVLEPIRAEHGVPGLAAAVLRDGKVVSGAAVGVRRVGADARLTLNDKFHLGSCTKAMTATLAAIMVSEGAIRWDSKVGATLRDAVGEDLDPGWDAITLEDLLNHRGGAPADLPPFVFATRGQPTRDARKLLVRALLNKAPGPRGTSVYSNAGYVLAGAMLEQAGKASWESLVFDKLFRPLEITSAGFGAPGLPGALDQPRGHRAATTQPLEPTPFSDNPLAIGPAGTVHMTLGDWLRFVALHVRGGRADNHPDDNRDLLGISPQLFNRLHTARGDDDGEGPRHAFGWIVARSKLARIPVLAHDGSNTLWYASVWASPRLNLAVVVATNQGGDAASDACHAAMEAILRQQLSTDSDESDPPPR